MFFLLLIREFAAIGWIFLDNEAVKSNQPSLSALYAASNGGDWFWGSIGIPYSPRTVWGEVELRRVHLIVT
jgi:hypothetical protein